jgi:hypothetical protein
MREGFIGVEKMEKGSCNFEMLKIIKGDQLGIVIILCWLVS